MNKNIILIGLGHRARQGKDWAAEYLHHATKETTAIVHFADELYKECRNDDRKHPLISKTKASRVDGFSLLSNEEDCTFRWFPCGEIPQLDAFMKDKPSQYWGMDSKDSPLLQLWGTNFRRKYCGDTYWVNKTDNYINALAYKRKDNFPLYVFIPDVRFSNEYNYLRTNNGYYIDCVRYNEDGSRYYDPSRDMNHDSEKQLEFILDNELYDYIIKARSGEIDLIERKAAMIFNDIVLTNSITKLFAGSEAA